MAKEKIGGILDTLHKNLTSKGYNTNSNKNPFDNTQRTTQERNQERINREYDERK